MPWAEHWELSVPSGYNTLRSSRATGMSAVSASVNPETSDTSTLRGKLQKINHLNLSLPEVSLIMASSE